MSGFKSSLKLNQHTNIGKEELKKLNQMLSQLLQNNDSLEFRQAVDWKGLGLMDYPNIIKYPMDLGTCKEKLKNNEYNFVEDSLDDIQLVWDNCKNYNAEGSWIYKLAEKLEKHFKNMIKNYLPSIQFMNAVVKKEKLSQMKNKQDDNSSSQNGDLPIQTNNTTNGSKNSDANNGTTQNQNQIYQEEEASEAITTQDKILFSQKIKMLPTEQLGMIVLMIQNSASQAFKDIDKEKCQILVDQIDPETFKKINQQIDLWNVSTETTTKRVKI
ncbi:hypothetical protein ABPG72_011410 [Tetrahymena utriculariae]